jgi:hypothetical protein
MASYVPLPLQSMVRTAKWFGSCMTENALFEEGIIPDHQNDS